MNVEEFRKNAHEVIDFICDYYKNIESFPVQSQIKPGDVANKLPKDAPENGEPFSAIMKDVNEVIVPGITHWQSPNFFAYFPSNGSFPSILGDLLSSGFGVQGMLWITSPACTELETVVLDWLGKMLQLPKEFLSEGEGGGVIQGTASEAVLVCLVAARFRALRKHSKNVGDSNEEDELKSKLVVYASDQAHSSIKKACMVAGHSLSRFRVIKTDANMAFDLNELEKTIEEDKKNGLIPFYLCSTVGTTSTTAIDPIKTIGQLCQKEGIWLHIDAAYAGSACICPEYRHYIDGIEYADSFNFNPHKWMLVNFDCSALWVKSRSDLIDALSVTPAYLRNKASESGSVIDYRDWQVPLGRRFRALKLWFVLRTYGVKGLQKFIREHISIAEKLEWWIKETSGFELVQPRTLALVCFRAVAFQDEAKNNEINKALLEKINEEGKIYLTQTIVQDKYTIRVSIGSATTTEEHVRKAWDYIKEETQKLLLS